MRHPRHILGHILVILGQILMILGSKPNYSNRQSCWSHLGQDTTNFLTCQGATKGTALKFDFLKNGKLQMKIGKKCAVPPKIFFNKLIAHHEYFKMK